MRRVHFAAVLVVTLAAPTAFSQHASPHALIRAPKNLPSHVTPPAGRGVGRSRLVAVDLGPLARAHATRGRAVDIDIALELDLFDGARHRARLESVTAGANGGEVYEGRLEDAAEGSIVLAVIDGEIFANIRTIDRWYQIRHVGDGIYAVSDRDASVFPPSLDPIVPPDDHMEAAPIVSDVAVAADNGSVIDMLVMYTPKAKTAVGGLSAITNLINTAIAETNTAYQRSGVMPRLRLVHTAETTNWLYNGSPINADSYLFEDMLAMLQHPSDGPMDAAHPLRNTYGADAVALIVDRGDVCGIGYLMSNLSSTFASNAFSVVHWDCATGYYSFGHEVGHNMGLNHDRANAGGKPAYSYGLGWQDPGGNFRTIMAYGGALRIQNFSNPNVTYNGLPTGSPVGTATEAHAAQALNNAALTFSNFRASVTPTCTYDVTPATAAFNATGGTGAVNVTVTSGTGCSWTASTGSPFITITGGASGSGSGTVTYTVAANGITARSGSMIVAGETVTVTQAGGAPTGLIARATAPDSILLTWNAMPDTYYYVIQRRETGETSFSNWDTSDGPTYTDDWHIEPGKAYLYRVLAYTTGGISDYGNADVATTVLFTDDPLTAGSTTIRSEHLIQLRQGVAAIRALAGLGAPVVTNSTLTGVVPKAVHIAELRTQLDAALTLLSLPSGGWLSGVTNGAPVKANHFQQLRDRMR